MIHVGGTRFVTSTTDNNMNIHARITVLKWFEHCRSFDLSIFRYFWFANNHKTEILFRFDLQEQEAAHALAIQEFADEHVKTIRGQEGLHFQSVQETEHHHQVFLHLVTNTFVSFKVHIDSLNYFYFYHHQSALQDKDEALAHTREAHQRTHLSMQTVVRLKTVLHRIRLKKQLRHHSNDLLQLVKQKDHQHQQSSAEKDRQSKVQHRTNLKHAMANCIQKHVRQVRERYTRSTCWWYFSITTSNVMWLGASIPFEKIPARITLEVVFSIRPFVFDNFVFMVVWQSYF